MPRTVHGIRKKFVNLRHFKLRRFYSSIKIVKTKDIFLILYNIRSAYNVGAIFRTADAAGVKKIYLCGYTPTPEFGNFKTQPPKLKAKFQHYDKIAKTALGAEKTVPWEQHKQTWRLLEKLRKNKIRIAAIEQAPKSVNLFLYKSKFPLALIVGHERKGLSDKILNYVDDILEIPMHGAMVRQAHHPRHTRRGKESLNVSVAAGVALYELIK